MTKKQEIYRCPICGNIIEVLHEGAQLSCCGRPMERLEEKVSDGAYEKHVPVAEQKEDGLYVRVGSMEHPMADDHYIQWIEVLTPTYVMRRHLRPHDKPEALFPHLCEAACGQGSVVVRAYCNMHGLWKK